MGRGEGPAIRIHGQGCGPRLGLVQGGGLVGAAVPRKDVSVRQTKDDGVRLRDDVFCVVDAEAIRLHTP